MNNFAKQIHSKYHLSCLETINKAIKLLMPFEDILLILYYFNQAFKSPFLDQDDFFIYSKNRPFGDLMEELFTARTLVEAKMCKELQEIEEKLSIWRIDADTVGSQSSL